MSLSIANENDKLGDRGQIYHNYRLIRSSQIGTVVSKDDPRKKDQSWESVLTNSSRLSCLEWCFFFGITHGNYIMFISLAGLRTMELPTSGNFSLAWRK